VTVKIKLIRVTVVYFDQINKEDSTLFDEIHFYMVIYEKKRTSVTSTARLLNGHVLNRSWLIPV